MGNFEIVFSSELPLSQVRRDIRRKRRALETERRNTNRHMKAIKKDLDRMFPNSDVLEAVDVLVDLDIVWAGDFDKLREPLADLLLKVDKSGLFHDDVEQIIRVLLSAPVRGNVDL